MTLLEPGQVLRDTYEVERFLGSGAFAEVYRVNHCFMGRQAMKVFKTGGMTIDKTREMLEEAILLSGMEHPNIIRVFDANIIQTSRGICGFFTMEYVAGGTLHDFWKSHGARLVPVETVIDVMRQVCQGIAIAHAESPPIVHRDIKPQNVLVGYDASGLRARVSDFGLAKRVNPLTMMATAVGTLPFKPPEVFKDPKGDSCGGDVWALGVMLYLLLTDRLPYGNFGALDLVDGTVFDQPAMPPSRLNLEVDAELDGIVFRALAHKPEERHANADEMLGDLRHWHGPETDAVEEHKSVALPPTSKAALGAEPTVDQSVALEMAAHASELAHQASKLREAADLMEEAFNKWPPLRERYEDRLKLWRNGIAM